MSLILPYSGVIAVEAIRYAVTSQDRLCTSPRSRPMVGSALARMVWSSDDMNTGSSMPQTMSRISLWLSVDGGSASVVASIESFRGPAAVDHQRRAGHQRGGVGGEKNDRAGQLLELAEPAELDLGQHLVAKDLVLEERPGHRRL